MEPLPEIVKRQYGKGMIISGEEIYTRNKIETNNNDTLDLYPDYSFTAEILKEAGIFPDFSSSGDIRYTHRSLNEREIYFISNRKDSVVKDTCYFRDGTDNAEIWDAVTGEIYPAGPINNKNGMKSIVVSLDPYQSCFIVFNISGNPGPDRSSEISPFTVKTIVCSLEGPWDVSFDTALGRSVRNSI